MSPTGPPTAQSAALTELAATLSPAATLARIDAHATRLISQVSLIATFVAAGGLVTTASLTTSRGPRALAVAAVVAVLLAVVLAVLAQLTWLRRLAVGNLLAVQEWYRTRAAWRGLAVATATWVFAAGVILAASAVTWAVVGGEAARPQVAVERVLTPPTSTDPAQHTVTVTVAGKGFEPFAAGSTTVRAAGATVASAVWSADGTGTVASTLTASAPDVAEVAVTVAGWTCTSPASDDGSLRCTGP
ncbi:MAG: hypothetical protein KJ792_10410 [Actinobacteria bacterium]|nr:hypothetical protein [Actinomycetota bacterium]MCG2802320.1 hypothetical protein [Cellulomonas sp.]